MTRTQKIKKIKNKISTNPLMNIKYNFSAQKVSPIVGAVLFIGLNEPFVHYERVLGKPVSILIQFICL